MPERHDNIIHKLFLRSKTIKAILSSITRIRLIIYIKDPKEAFSINHVHIEEDTVITGHPIRSNAISIINLTASQASI